MLKRFRWLLWLAFAFVLGFIFSFLVYNGYWYRLIDGLKTLRWYHFFMWLILTFLITLIIHELGHLFAFVFQGVKIRALYLYMLIVYKTKKGWRLKLKPKLWFLLGGFVVPDLDDIVSDEDYESLVAKFSRSLIAAPIVTIILLILTILLFLLSIVIGFGSSFIGQLTLFTFYTILLSSLYIKSFKLSNQSFYGDFVAHQKMKSDPVFQIVQISQYTMFSLNPSKETENYLFQKVKSVILNEKLKSTLFHQVILINYIEDVCFQGFEDDPLIREKIMNYPLGSLYHSEQGITLLYDIAIYYYHLGWVEKSYQLINKIKTKSSQKIDQKMREYLEKKHLHILHIAYDDAYLSNKEHYVFRMSSLFEDLIDFDEMMKSMHQPLPFRVWESPVNLDDENKNGSN